MSVYQGKGGELVKPEHAWAMISELERNGVPHETFWLSGRDHIEAFLLPGDPVIATIRFLDREMR